MTLEAVNQGLATCWVGAMSGAEAHKVMGLPEEVFVHDVLALGYADESPRLRPRKPVEKIAFWETYG